jgi:hypothetical protein
MCIFCAFAAQELSSVAAVQTKTRLLMLERELSLIALVIHVAVRNLKKKNRCPHRITQAHTHKLSWL